MSVFSIYAEKKPAYAVEAASVCADLRSIVGIKSITGLRIINRFFIEGISFEKLDAVKAILFSDSFTDTLYDKLPDFGASRILVSELLPGQFDQDADSYAQCLALASGGVRPLVSCAKIYIFEGEISDSDFNAVKSWLINPVERRECSLNVPTTLVVDYNNPEEVGILDGFISLDESALTAMQADFGLSMDLADLLFCQAYFRDEERRNPTVTELKMLDTYWSDHCRHTTFFTELTNIEILDDSIRDSYKRYLALRTELGRDEKPVTLMDLATIGARVLKARGFLPDLDESEEVNACSVKIKAKIDGEPQDWLLMFKNETHNHPTEMEPFGGAATCLGGAVRDPMSGRSYVYQAMRITGAGDPRADVSETLPGKLPQRKICQTAADGYSNYGNQLGAATGHLHEIYHPGYIAKRMELGAVIAAAPATNVVRKQPAPGDVVILLGGKTGRDGCGGATGSSKSHTVNSQEIGGAEVQRGDAPEEHKITRLFRNPEATRLIKRCNDFGAGGVSVAIGELADGLEIDLNKVPVKYGGLDGTELAISESQERMAVVTARDDAAKFIELADAENIDAVIIASVTDEPRVTMSWNGKTIVSLARSFLSSNGVPKRASVSIAAPDFKHKSYPALDRDGLERLMSDLSICSQKGLADRFDYSVGAATMLAPFGGIQQLTPSQVMAAKLPVLDGDTSTCSLMSWGFDPFISAQSPYHGAMAAVIHSVAKLIAAGGRREKCWLTFQEYFERLRNEPSRWGKPAAALLGALDAQIGLMCGSIGGKDSMSGSYEDIDVPPTLVSFAVSVAEEENIISAEFKSAGNNVYFLQPGFAVFDNYDFEALRNLFDKVEGFIADGKVKSAWATGVGGTAEAVLKMGFGNRIGFAAAKPLTSEPIFGGFVIEAEELPGLEDYLLGTTTEDYNITLSNGQTADMSELQAAWEQPLESVYPRAVSSDEQIDTVETLYYENNTPAVSVIKTTSPKFVIPLLPGTNSEHDIERAIVRARGKVETIVIRNRNETDIAESLYALAKSIRTSQGIVLPGGDVSANFIVSLFMNTEIQDATAELLQKHDGLIYGVGAGFRALTKLGLLPYGEIRVEQEPMIAITENKTGRHRSVMVNVKVVSNKSPWLSGFDVGYCAVQAVSSEYCRFVAEESLIRTLAESGQIATQYVDLNKQPTSDIRFNPGGSDFAIEGITSPDGRIFGRMAHSERSNSRLLINIPGNKDMNVFLGAVKWFA